MKTKTLYIIAFVFYFFQTSNIKAQILTKGEVYDLYPGDKYAYYFGSPGGPEEFRFIKVLDRQLTQDTLKILYFRASYRYVFSKNDYQRFVDSFYGVYTNLDEYIFPAFTENDTLIYYHDSTHPNYTARDSMYQDSCGNWYNYRNVEEWTGLSGSTKADSFAVAGIGFFIYYITDPGGGGLYGHTDKLMYYYKDPLFTCGNQPKYPLSMDYILNNQLIFYPNPSNNKIQFDIESDAFYSIYNVNGQLVTNGKTTDGSIDISDLNSGNYQVQVITENNVRTGILVKK